MFDPFCHHCLEFVFICLSSATIFYFQLLTFFIVSFRSVTSEKGFQSNEIHQSPALRSSTLLSTLSTFLIHQTGCSLFLLPFMHSALPRAVRLKSYKLQQSYPLLYFISFFLKKKNFLVLHIFCFFNKLLINRIVVNQTGTSVKRARLNTWLTNYY